MGLPHGLAILVEKGLAGAQMVVGEIVFRTAFHQGQRLVIEIDVFPLNGTGCGALGDQPPGTDEVEVCTVDVQPCQKSTADVTPLTQCHMSRLLFCRRTVRPGACVAAKP